MISEFNHTPNTGLNSKVFFFERLMIGKLVF